MITITDKDGRIHLFNTAYIEKVEFSKGGLCVIFKDSRQEPVTIKAKSLSFS